MELSECSSVGDRLLPILIVWPPIPRYICIPTSRAKLSCSPFLLLPRPMVHPPRAQVALRPLPRIPPPHLTLPHPADIRSYRPLPTPPLQSSDSNYTSSSESLYLWTPPTRVTLLAGATSPRCITRDSSSSSSSLSSSSELLIKPRPRLRISVAAPNLRKSNSLDSLTVRSPTLCDPGQGLLPIIDRWDDTLTIDPSLSMRAPRASTRSNRVSAVDSVISPLVFNTPTAAAEAELNTPESEEEGKSVLARTLSIPQLTCLTWTCPSSPYPGTEKKLLRVCCGSATTPTTTEPGACGLYRNCQSCYFSQRRG